MATFISLILMGEKLVARQPFGSSSMKWFCRPVMICLVALKPIGCRMSATLNLRTMRTIAEGQVNSLKDFITLHRIKKTRGEAWFIQQEEILQHRRQVVTLIDAELSRRQERESEAA